MKYLTMILMLQDVGKVYAEEAGKGKPWYLSRRFVGVCLLVLGAIAANIFGVTIDEALLNGLADTWVRLIPDLISIYGLIMAAVGQIRRGKGQGKDENIKQMGIVIFMAVALLSQLSACSTMRRYVVQPVLNEEITWTKMYKTWSHKAFQSKDFRAGFLAGATGPFSMALSQQLKMAMDAVITQGAQDTPEWAEGFFGGSTLALYGSAANEGVGWLIRQLVTMGAIE